MISEYKQQSIPLILSNAAQKAYDKIKALILKIFSIIKKENNNKNLKEEFYESYMSFARKLKEEGHDEECYNYMSICEMYYDLMDRPDELIAHERFFMDLFEAFDELLFVKINQSETYGEKYNEFILYSTKMQQYYYTKVAIPSPHYNEKVCRDIIGHLSGDLDE